MNFYSGCVSKREAVAQMGSRSHWQLVDVGGAHFASFLSDWPDLSFSNSLNCGQEALALEVVGSEKEYREPCGSEGGGHEAGEAFWRRDVRECEGHEQCCQYAQRN